MIWEKPTTTNIGATLYRYGQCFEYMFILTKGYTKTFNPIKDKKNKFSGKKTGSSIRNKDGSIKNKKDRVKISEFGIRNNIWKITPELSDIRKLHPAPFPEQLVIDHILSWSNEGDIVLDPFMGSGTTAISCIKTNRNYIGFEISKEYCDIADRRIENTYTKEDLF